ncbi:Nnf1-domain-containing protein [Didymella exigua CBS 183.55]|uniref:Nnf1-domain-containing protein n=1 Tax=Didymella exigua CBS 183.55 TaxID=1150837 RepID=A0A6A5S2G4_9PLEO|nr:Nnf1-domain-containing protein [Didymella exigua CBS 183.55]KAF1934103.1 Nnf1-domain-containing protein [Didymella exigua CBS 183.55]
MPAATNSPSRSSSPAPAPPVAEAPGPRAQGLINVFNKAAKATLDKCSSENFASCFPTAAQYAPETLEGLRSQIVDQLDRTWKVNFEEILKKRDVIKLVNELEQCIEDAKLRKKRAELSGNGGSVHVPVPPHTLTPSEIHLAHLMPFLEKQATDMNSELAEAQTGNTVLLTTVAAQRAEIEALVRGLESIVSDLEASAQLMAQDDVQDLSAEIRHVEMGMRT